MAISRLTLTFKDFDSEKSNANFRGAVAAEATVNPLWTALENAVIAVTTGTLVKSARVINEIDQDAAAPTDQYSQRETKWLVRCMGTTTGRITTVEIPTADLALLDNTSPDPNVRKSLDLTADEGLALVTAIEAYHESVGAEEIEVIEIIHVGRNL